MRTENNQDLCLFPSSSKGFCLIGHFRLLPPASRLLVVLLKLSAVHKDVWLKTGNQCCGSGSLWIRLSFNSEYWLKEKNYSKQDYIFFYITVPCKKIKFKTCLGLRIRPRIRGIKFVTGSDKIKQVPVSVKKKSKMLLSTWSWSSLPVNVIICWKVSRPEQHGNIPAFNSKQKWRLKHISVGSVPKDIQCC